MIKNVIDQLQNLSVPDIKEYCLNKIIPASCCMINIEGDFNFSTMIRNANFFGFSSVHYVGKKKWDRRGSVGTHHYTPIYYHRTEHDFLETIIKDRDIVCIENNVGWADKTHELFTYDLAGLKDPIFVFGSENCGLSDIILSYCKVILTMSGYGSVRSLNVGTASGIVLGLYRSIIERKY
jgi:tRNA G18 (ribose-2'-O)-methylase SpoU